jgi:hypothetical protein
MSIVPSTNYSAAGTQFNRATDDTDTFDREHLAALALALEEHTHASTRGLPVSRLAAGAIDASNLFGAAIVPLTALAANIITGVSVTSTPGGADSNTSLTYVDMDDMSITFTAVGGSSVALVLWMTPVSINPAGNRLDFALKMDAASESWLAQLNPDSTNLRHMIGFGVFTGLSAGSHTVKLRWLVEGGTGTVNTERKMAVIHFSR